MRKTFRELLQGRPEFTVVGEAVNGIEAIAQARVLRPDVVLMDVSMPEMDGIDTARLINHLLVKHASLRPDHFSPSRPVASNPPNVEL